MKNFASKKGLIHLECYADDLEKEDFDIFQSKASKSGETLIGILSHVDDIPVLGVGKYLIEE